MNPLSLTLLAVGPMTTRQDAGRFGYMRYGITPAGVMDQQCYAMIAKLLAWETEQSVIEIPLGGLQFRTSEAVSCAFLSRGFDLRRNGQSLGACAVFVASPGDLIEVRAGAMGNYAYLGVAARERSRPVLGAMASHLRSGIAPWPGRALQAGDQLLFEHSYCLPERLGLPALALQDTPIRCILGPQADYFDSQNLARFVQQTWHISPRSDRMAIGLQGVPLQHREGFDVLSDGVNFGSIQLPGDGLPLVLMADRQPTGGYPKIANIISADLPRFAQMRAGQSLRFAWCDCDVADAARQHEAAQLADWINKTPAADLRSETLLSKNLVSGVIDAKPR